MRDAVRQVSVSSATWEQAGTSLQGILKGGGLYLSWTFLESASHGCPHPRPNRPPDTAPANVHDFQSRLVWNTLHRTVNCQTKFLMPTRKPQPRFADSAQFAGLLLSELPGQFHIEDRSLGPPETWRPVYHQPQQNRQKGESL